MRTDSVDEQFAKMKKGAPIRPSEVTKSIYIPPFVFDCFNELVVKNYANGKSIVNLKDVEFLITKECEAMNILMVYEWLKVKDNYESSGWKVEYGLDGLDSYTFSK